MFIHKGDEASNIREATANDEAALSALFREVVGAMPFMTDQMRTIAYRNNFEDGAFIKKLYTSGNVTLLAVNDGRPIGFALAEPMSEQEQKAQGFPLPADVLWLSWIGVQATYRRHAVASALLDAVKMRKAFAQARVDCASLKQNTVAHRLLRENEFMDLGIKIDSKTGDEYFLFGFNPKRPRKTERPKHDVLTPGVRH